MSGVVESCQGYQVKTPRFHAVLATFSAFTFLCGPAILDSKASHAAGAHQCIWAGQPVAAWEHEALGGLVSAIKQNEKHVGVDANKGKQQVIIVIDSLLPIARRHNPAAEAALAVFLKDVSSDIKPTDVPENQRTPSQWMELAQHDLAAVATDTKDARAAFMLAQTLDPGSDHSLKTLNTDMSDAEHWYLTAARAGLPEAQVDLALFLINNGMNKSSDGTEPIDWLTRAAEAGAGNAQGLLSDLLADPTGGHSPILAYAWAIVSDRNGDPIAIKNRTLDERSLSKSDLSQAKEISEEIYSLLPLKECQSID